MRSLLRRVFAGFRVEAPRAPRLTAAEAQRLAEAALGGGVALDAVARLEGDRIIWSASEMNFGSGRLVRLDDATGEVLEVTRWGVR